MANWLKKVTNLLDNITVNVDNSETTFVKDVTSAANAGQIDIATVSANPVVIEAIIVKSDGATTADFTNMSVQGGTNASPTTITFVQNTDATYSNLNSEAKQVGWAGWPGAIYLEPTYKIVATLTGSGATAVDFKVIVKYKPVQSGGMLV